MRPNGARSLEQRNPRRTGDRHWPATADPATRKSFAAPQPVTPCSPKRQARMPPRAASVAPAAVHRLQSNRQPRPSIASSCAHSSQALAPIKTPKHGRRLYQTDRVVAAGYDRAGLPGPAETMGGDAASRVHAVALITIAPITRPAWRFELLTPRFVVRIPSHRRASVQGTSERRKYFCYSPLG